MRQYYYKSVHRTMEYFIVFVANLCFAIIGKLIRVYEIPVVRKTLDVVLHMFHTFFKASWYALLTNAKNDTIRMLELVCCNLFIKVYELFNNKNVTPTRIIMYPLHQIFSLLNFVLTTDGKNEKKKMLFLLSCIVFLVGFDAIYFNQQLRDESSLLKLIKIRYQT